MTAASCRRAPLLTRRCDVTLRRAPEVTCHVTRGVKMAAGRGHVLRDGRLGAGVKGRKGGVNMNVYEGDRERGESR